MSYALEVENLSKKYQLGELERYYTFRDTLANIIKAPIRKFLSNNNRSSPKSRVTGSESSNPEFIWALKDVSFQVKHGEILGIIGRNGAGKSTLLKLLSRITAPTEGTIKINGSVGSLLEVGTGFHPELTGRENISLNGSILGMSRKEINKKFNEIVDFAEVEKFIDTPVKRYSSGMYLRLAFAVAAHLDSEILIVDEVLAVGDIAFQKKCLGKMENVSKTGRTVLFVSHNLTSIRNLCAKSILLDIGQLKKYEETEIVINEYLKKLGEVEKISIRERKDRKGDGNFFKFLHINIKNTNNEKMSIINSGQDVIFEIFYEIKNKFDFNRIQISLSIRNHLGQLLINCPTGINDNSNLELDKNCFLVCKIPRLPLNEGSYKFNLYSTIDGIEEDYIQDAGFFEVIAGDFYNIGRYTTLNKNEGVLIKYDWKISKL